VIFQIGLCLPAHIRPQVSFYRIPRHSWPPDTQKVATQPIFWHHQCVVKTLALEDIYADPHTLDSYLISGEPVAVVRNGQRVAEFLPHRDDGTTAGVSERPFIDFRARFLKMWGPDAFKNEISVAEQFEQLRRPREL